MGFRIYLRLSIGLVNGLFVLLVGAFALLITASVSLSTLRDNGERHVNALGTAATSRIDTFFGRIEGVSRGARDAVRAEDMTLPADDVTRRWTPAQLDTAGITPGGKTMQRIRDIWFGLMAQVNYEPLTLNMWLVDGSRVVCLPITPAAPLLMVESMFQTDVTSPIPFASPKLNRSLLALNPVTRRTLARGENPTADAWLDNRDATYPKVDLRAGGVQNALKGLTNMTPGSEPLWSPVRYFYTDVDFLYLFAMSSLYNSTGAFLGFALTAVGLDGIGATLDAVRPTVRTAIAVLDADDFLIGATSGITVFTKSPLTNLTAPIPAGCTSTEQSKNTVPSTQNLLLCRYNARVAGHPALRKLAQSGGIHQADHQELVKTDDGTYYVRVNHLREVTLRATVIVMVPEKDIIGDVERLTMVAAGATLGVVIIAALLSFFMVWFMLRPLQGIAVRMGKAARLEEDKDAVDESLLVEIGDLQRAFVEMRDELARIRAFVPQSLLCRASESEAEGNLEDELDYDEGTDDETVSLNRTPGSEGQSRSSGSFVPATGTKPQARPMSAGATARSDQLGASYMTGRESASFVEKKGTGGVKPRGLRTSVGMKRETVTILTINLRGFHRVFAATATSVGRWAPGAGGPGIFGTLPQPGVAGMAPQVDVSNMNSVATLPVIDDSERDIPQREPSSSFKTPLSPGPFQTPNSRGALVVGTPAQKQAALSQPSTGFDAKTLGAFVELVIQAAEQEKGVVDFFHGDRFQISYNAVRPAAAHGTRASLTALRLCEKLKSGAVPALRGYNIPITAGIMTGVAHVGNVGCSSAMKFSIVGPVVSQSVAMERLAKVYMAGAAVYAKSMPGSAAPTVPSSVCLVPQRLFEDLKTAATVQVIDYVSLPFGKNPVLVGQLLKEHVRGEQDEEWMYQLSGAATGTAALLASPQQEVAMDSLRADDAGALLRSGESPSPIDLPSPIPRRKRLAQSEFEQQAVAVLNEVWPLLLKRDLAQAKRLVVALENAAPADGEGPLAPHLARLRTAVIVDQAAKATSFGTFYELAVL